MLHPWLKLAFLLGFTSLSSCGFIQYNLHESDTISGSIFQNSSKGLSASNTCTNSKVILFDIESPQNPLADSTINADGTFEFKGLRDKGVKISSSNIHTQYLLRFTCNDEVLMRYVTGSTEQNIDYGTTILGWFTQTQEITKIKDVKTTHWENLYTQLKTATSLTQAKDIVSNNTAINNEIKDVGLNPVVLNDASPVVKELLLPAIFKEETTNILNATVYHWSPNYDFAYEWRVNGSLLSTQRTYNFVPGANQQGTYTLQFFVGQKNSHGQLDTQKLYAQSIASITVQNNVLPTVPTVQWITNSYMSSTQLRFRLTTGAKLTDTIYQNCRSFDRLYIADDLALLPAIPPHNPQLFNQVCSEENHQEFVFTGAGVEGQRQLRIWAMDASGTVSSSPQVLNYVYDTTAPSLTFSSPVEGSHFQNTLTLSGTCENDLPVEVLGSGLESTPAGNCSQGQFSMAVTLSAGEGSKSFQVRQTDLAGNQTTISRTVYKDTIAPSIALTSPVASTAAQNDLTISGSCESELLVQIEGTGVSSTSQTACSGGSFTANVTFSAGDGNKLVTVRQTDLAGNTQTSSRTFVKDTTPPVLTWSTPAANAAYRQAFTITGNCEAPHTVNISGDLAEPLTATCAAGSFSRSVTLVGADGNKTLQIAQSDAAGNSSQVQRNFLLDTTAPQAQFLSINNNEANTGNKNVVISLTANSSRSDIQAFCLKMNDSAKPDANASCWVTLASIGLENFQDAQVSNFPYQLGSLLGDYEISVWWKDQLGNISDNTNAVNVDIGAIFYAPDPPPTISNIVVSSTDTPQSPLTLNDTTILKDADLYIQWSASDNNPIPNGNISLDYTYNENDFFPLQGSLNNSNNGGCTLREGFTGCVRLAARSPASSYFKVRISVTDTSQTVSLANSNPLNTGKFKVLSGNTSLGLGGSASSAILLGRGESAFNDNADPQAFVVTKKGDIFFNYSGKGLAHVSPITGSIEIIAKNTGTTLGNGGPLANATFQNLLRLALDYQDRLLIWDQNTVRRVDLASPDWTIDRIAGGGGDTTDGALATSASLPNLNREDGLFTVMPNGNFYFDKGLEIWFYEESSQKIKKHISLSGTGIGHNTGAFTNYSIDLCNTRKTGIAFNKNTSSITKIIRQGQEATGANCGALSQGSSWSKIANFNTTTGMSTAPHPPDATWSSTHFTGMDGNLYTLQQGRRTLTRYNPTTNQYDIVVGTNSNGRCIDSTPANQCPATIMSAFVNEFGQVYFLDMGVLRTVDAQQTVRTIAGQPRNFGINNPAASARYSQINYFDVNGDNVYVVNKLENQIVRFSLNGGNLSHVAGNSILGDPSSNSLATEAPLAACGWAMPCGLSVDGTLKRLYYRRSNFLSYIDLDTGRWFNSAVTPQQGDNRVSYLGKAPNGTMLAYVPSHYGSSGDYVTLQEIDSDLTYRRIYGLASVNQNMASELCTNDIGTNCSLRHTQGTEVQTQAKFDVTTNEWLFTYQDRSYIHRIPLNGGTSTRYTTTSNGVRSFAYKYDQAEQFILFYCAPNGRLYKKNVTANTADVELPLPSNTITCNGQAMHYHEERDSLLFIFRQNDMSGIAEYSQP